MKLALMTLLRITTLIRLTLGLASYQYFSISDIKSLSKHQGIVIIMILFNVLLNLFYNETCNDFVYFQLLLEGKDNFIT